ncbi:hypothetical protein C7H19_23095 [Aphanothece hegewaldii CCALA 016]|uniref:DUF4426 domain-containing protein n=1 Tax=Aphanothece hegewaldii CCALA 016 TaxID=2107694 RepID=A0A2T1LRF2_9CHRO|nr:hypothetical protein [Aphanothece hegewaldii]PSF31271.1 hypothetical protein C7H19_23095 [Aphanothece hegewaldii CCALA 016]
MKINLIILSVFGSVLISNLSQSEQAIASNIFSNNLIAEAGASKPTRGGQVVEQGAYHLELVPEKAKEGVHLDFYLQKGDNHQAILNAKVTGQVQLPNGTQKNLNFKYDTDGKHYTVLLSEKASGQYQVRITAEMNGQKVNGRFSFKQ